MERKETFKKKIIFTSTEVSQNNHYTNTGAFSREIQVTLMYSIHQG